MTIFHLAALRSETRLYYLLGEGADSGILTNKGRNALHLACRARQSNVVGYLCQVSSGSRHLLFPVPSIKILGLYFTALALLCESASIRLILQDY